MAVYIIMGVSGVGKTTIGKLLAKELKLPFYDADDFHPPENISKMKSGIPLQDNDREKWLTTLAEEIQKWNRAGGAVLACSALKEKYRKILTSIPKKDLQWIYLKADFEPINNRLKLRKGHYFKPELLKSQFDTLEPPTYGIHINAENPIEKIRKELMEKISSGKSQMGLVGLGVMGKSLALNLAFRQISLSVFNREVKDIEVEVAKNFVQSANSDILIQGFSEIEQFVNSLETPRNIILMVNAGKTVDIVIDNLLPFLEKDDLIIDGGNSHYKDTNRREVFLKERGLHFIGAGISGGEEGALKGPSIMPGGEKEIYKRVSDYLEKIAARDKLGNACCTYIGPGGAGHFVKMLHNGIEYAEMQLIAEIYHLLRFSYELSPEEIAGVFETWNLEMKSYLLEISGEILRRKENEEFLLDKILDAAKQKGTGGWSTNAALELGVPLDTITASVMARIISGKKERTVASEKYDRIFIKQDFSEMEQQIVNAYKAAGIINHAIGFDMLEAASSEYNWNLDLSEIARIWTNGCIIRSGLMEELVEIFNDFDENLLLHPNIIQKVDNGLTSLTNTTGQAMKAGFPVPVLSAALNYFLSFTSKQTSANMIQAQRDYFGAHTYERTDKPRGKFFHTQWKDSY